MQIYWKMINELREMGEVLVIHDPSILREYRRWCMAKNVAYGGTFKTSPFLTCALLRN